jgi:hypothetical protein
MKTCRVCKREKPNTDFYSDKKRMVCKKCKNKRTAPISRNYTTQNKELVLRHYSPDLKCACKKCPYPYPGIEFLSLDHINGKGEHGREIRRRLYQWVKNNNFPKGFQVLCYNCNLAKREHAECPHNNPLNWTDINSPRQGIETKD